MNRANAEQNNTLRPGFTDIANSLDGLKTRVMNLIASVRLLGNYIRQLESERGSNISDIGTNTEDANELKRQIAKLQQDYKTLQQDLLNSQQQNALLQNNLDRIKQDLNQCNTDKAQLEKQITAMQAEIDRLNSLPKPDPEEIKQLKAEVQRLNNEIQQRQQQLDNLNNLVIPGLNKQISDLKASIAPLNKQIADLTASIAPLQQQIAKCNQDLEEANRNIAALRAQNQDLTDQITASTGAITKIIATINASRFQLDPKLTQDITTQRDELATQIDQLEVIVNSLLPGKGSSSSSGRGFSPKAAASTRSLPQGWRSAVDPVSGDPYYINTATRSTQWEFPDVSSSSENTPSSRGSSFSSGEGSQENLTSTTAGTYSNTGYNQNDPSTSNSNSSNSRNSIRRKYGNSSTSSNASDSFGTSISNAYGQPVNVPSNLSKQPSLLSSSTIVGTLSNPLTQITIGSINTTLGQIKTALLAKSNTVSYTNNRYMTAYNAINRANNALEVPQIFTANKINIASNGAGGITLSPMPTGGKKSKKTKNKRKIIKQKGGFEYSGKSKRRRLTVTRSPRSSQSRSSPRSSSQRSSYETQSSVPTKYKARGTKKSKM
jgi:predicted  nucleic acid-binding Zn-ribbon protein